MFSDVLLELHAARLFTIRFIILLIKLLQLITKYREEHCIVHGLHMVLDISFGQQVCSMFHKENEQYNDPDTS